MSNYLAQLVNPALNSSIGNASVRGGVAITGQIVRGLINVAFIAGSIVFVAMLIMGGIQYISSGGDKESLQKSTKRISSALIGLVILFSLYVILGLLSAFTGLDLVNLTIPTFTNT
jgi:hypothetical protein